MTDQIVLVGLAAFGAAFVSGLGGFGGAFILVIALTPVVGAKAVIPLIAVYAICNNLSRVFIYRKSIAWKLGIQFTLASLPGIYIGANILASIPERALLGVLGAMLLSAIPLRRFLKKSEFTPGLMVIIGFGFVFGIISGAAAGSGMFVIAGLSSFGLTGAMLLGTDAAIGMVNAVSRVVAYYSLGLLTWDLFVIGLLMGVLTLPGAWAASKVVGAMGEHLHTKLIEMLILGGGAWLLYKAIFYSARTV